jgi:bifunctional non-homologous end joining protein LigD
MHGVLKSWAVPKGIPLAKNERRLAMATEDHPLEYIDFEGVIPEGEYGGGTVMIWDTGTYELVDGNYYKGHLHIYLSGSKLKGDWVLIKDKDKERNWYLIKVEDSMKPLSAKKENASAVSGRTMEQIANDRDRHWHSNRLPAELVGLPDAKIEFIEPMRAKVVSKLPQGDEWRYEIKLDGLRALAVKDTKVSLRSEDNKDLHFPKLAEALATLPDDSILDGVIVALDKDGRPSTDLLKKGRARRYYYATDVLALRGKSLLGLPFSERRSLLERLDLKDPVRISATFDADPAELAAAAKKQKIGALIAKRADSVYEPGGRSGAWLEVSLS